MTQHTSNVEQFVNALREYTSDVARIHVVYDYGEFIVVSYYEGSGGYPRAAEVYSKEGIRICLEVLKVADGLMGIDDDLASELKGEIFSAVEMTPKGLAV